MPVLPTISEDSTFHIENNRNGKVVDRPKPFGYYCTSKWGKRPGTAAKDSNRVLNSCDRADSAISRTNIRYRNKPMPTNPIYGLGYTKEYTLPMRALAGTVPKHEVNPQTVHVPRKRCIGLQFEQQYGSHVREASMPTERDASLMNSMHRGKRINSRMSSSSAAPTTENIQPETLRATSRYMNSRRFDMTYKPHDTSIGPVVTGREVFRRTSTTLEGVFAPVDTSYIRRGSIQPPPFHVER